MTPIVLLNGKRFLTHIPLDELYVLFKQVLQGRARIVIQTFQEGAETSLDIRRLDPEATFVDERYAVRESGEIAVAHGRKAG